MSMKCWIVWMFSLWGVLLQAKGQEYYFSHYGVSNGLSNNAVICGVQDKDGFLWFGTKDGLNRFDGYTFKQFYSDPESNNGLGSNFIHSLLVDSRKQLWVGTDQGLYKYDAYRERFTLFEGTEEGEVLDIKEDGRGVIWFISNVQLYSYDGTTSKLLKNKRMDGQAVSALAVDPTGDVWVSSTQAVVHVASGKTIVYPPVKNNDFWIETLTIDKRGNIWVGTSRYGVLYVDPTTSTVKHLIPYVEKDINLLVRDIQQVDEHVFWIASESGLLVYNQLTGSLKVLKNERDNPWSLSDNAVYTICIDHQGGIWAGTFFGGINYFHVEHTYFEKIYPRFLASSIRGHAVREMVEEESGNLWIGTEDNGLNYWDRSEGRFLHFSTTSGLSHHNIHGLMLAGDSLLIGTFHQGLDILDIKSKKRIAHFNSHNTQGGLGNDFIVCIYRTKGGRTLLATAQGLYEFFPGTDRFEVVKEAPNHIFYTSIFEDKDENIWLATWRDGLYRISAKDKKTQVFRHDPNDPLSINSNRINRIYQDSFGRIWIATERGLSMWESTAKPIRRFTKKDGLPSNLILTMTEDKHKKMWISTTYGLVCMDLQDYRLTVYNEESGLLDMQFNYNSVLQDGDGYLYFGSSNGMVRFSPDSLKKQHRAKRHVPIYITGVKSLQQEISIDDKNVHSSGKQAIYLDHDESTIHIDFAALNFMESNSTSYLYKLKGFDHDWSLSHQNTAYFTKIPPGTYTFYVKAMDKQGEVISDEISLMFVVRPPIWASMEAYVLYIVVFILLLYYLIRYYDNRIKEKNRRRLDKIKVHRERELYRAKIEFFSQVAHDIKTPLTLIKAPLEKIREMNGVKDERSVRLLDTMHKNTEKLVKLTDSILDFRHMEMQQTELKLKRENISVFVREYLQEFQPLFQQRNIDVKYFSEDNIEIMVDLEVISKIIENLLTNAVKYAEKRIMVNSTLDSLRKNWLLTIKNDGHVLNAQEGEKIFMPFQRADAHLHIEGSGLGLALAHSFATLHGGKLQFEENSENLNIFVLTIPVHESYA